MLKLLAIRMVQSHDNLLDVWDLLQLSDDVRQRWPFHFTSQTRQDQRQRALVRILGELLLDRFQLVSRAQPVERRDHAALMKIAHDKKLLSRFVLLIVDYRHDTNRDNPFRLFRRKKFLRMSRIKVICWDVYGTLLTAQRGDLDSLVRRAPELTAAFAQTIREFRLSLSAEVLCHDFLSAIAAQRAAKLAAGIAHPEIRIEEIWGQLAPSGPARDIALYFERKANPKQLAPGTRKTLDALKERGLRQGIISNAQFYTLIELSELLGGGFFDPALTFLSCDLGVAKPDLTAFHRAVETLARDEIRPAECLYVGDSPANDIAPAQQVGFRTLLIGPTGDIQQLPQLLERL